MNTRVAYDDPLGVYPELSQELAQQFPLTNLHWNPRDRPLRTIPKLEIELVPAEKSSPHQIFGLSDAPLVQITFLEAENYDVYRGKLRKSALQWARAVSSLREPTGWLVVHYVASKKHRSKNVWSKLQSDFEGHTAQIYLDVVGELDRREMWAKFCQALKQQVLWAFSARVKAFESEILKLQSTRDIVGWNFGSLFTMKESLANAFEYMNFFDDAYQIYLELERMAEPAFFHHKSVQVPPSLDNVFSPSRERIIENMLTQKASVFDFYCYLFSCQVLLLIKMAKTSPHNSLRDNHISVAVQRAIEWIPKLVVLLQKASGSEIQAIQWQLDVASQVYSLVRENSSDAAQDSRGQLLLLKRDALQSLASAKGYAIPGVLCSVPLSSNDIEVPQIGSEEDFQGRFFEITNQAIQAFAKARQTNSVYGLEAQIAIIEHERKNYAKALDILQSLPEQYLKLKWYDLSANLSLIYMDCCQQLGKRQEVLSSAWEILKLVPKISKSDAEKCLEKIRELGDEFPSQNNVEKWLNITILPYLDGDNRYFIKGTVSSKYPQYSCLEIERAVLVATIQERTGHSRKINFICNNFTPSGEIRFYSPHFVDGVIKVVSVNCYYKKQLLTQEFNQPILIRMIQLANCMHAELRLAKKFSLKKRDLEVHITSPAPVDARVKIQAVDGLQILYDKLTTTGLTQFEKAVVRVPALIRLEQPLARLKVTIEYGKGGILEFMEQVDMSFGTLVQVQEFFREEKVLSQFLISCTTSMPIIVDQVKLTDSRDYAVRDDSNSESHIVLDGAPVSLVYTLEPTNNPDQDSSMTLTLSHRPVKVECDYLIAKLVQENLSDHLKKFSLVIDQALKNITVDSVAYIVQGKVKVDEADIEQVLQSSFDSIEPSAREEICKTISTVLSECPIENSDSTKFECLNSDIEITVPQPFIEVVHFVRLDIEKKEEYVVGSEVLAKLQLNPISKWSDKPLPENIKFFFELDRFAEGWSIQGLSKSSFEGKSTIELSLIPHKAGKLSLPSVDVFTNQPITQEVVQRHRGEHILVVPEVNRLAITF